MTTDRQDPFSDAFLENSEGKETARADSELESRIEDWITQDNIENVQPCATLYKFIDPFKGEDKRQVNYFKGEIPSRHEIGLLYGGGRYFLVLTRPAGSKQPRKSTSYRFSLHDSYNALKAAKEQKDLETARQNVPAVSIGPYQGYTPPDNTAIFRETFSLMQGMMSTILQTLSPLLSRVQEPPKLSPPSGNMAQEQIGVYGALKDLLKTQTRGDIEFFNEMKRGFMTTDTATAKENDLDDVQPEEKQSILERLLTLAEPFIPLLAQNTMQAKAAAIGIRAMPQVQAAVKSITADPVLLQKVVSYVEAKEGREGAIIALRNMGIKVAGTPTPPARIARPVIRSSPPLLKKPGTRKVAPTVGVKKSGVIDASIKEGKKV